MEQRGRTLNGGGTHEADYGAPQGNNTALAPQAIVQVFGESLRGVQRNQILSTIITVIAVFIAGYAVAILVLTGGEYAEQADRYREAADRQANELSEAMDKLSQETRIHSQAVIRLQAAVEKAGINVPADLSKDLRHEQR